MKIMLSAVFFLCGMFLGGAQAATYYVSPLGTGADPKTWTGAWSEMDQINWTVVKPGDAIQIDGGDSGTTYTTKLITASSGTAAAPIRIQRSSQKGHNGPVVMLGQTKIWSKNVVFDGLEASKFTIIPTDSMCSLFVGYWEEDASGSQVRNLTIAGDYATSNGLSCSVYSHDCVVSGVVFDQSPGEDMLGVMTSGSITVENCTFRNLVGAGRDDCHRDVIGTYPGIGPGYVFTLRGNRFINNKTDNFAVFPNEGTALGGFVIENNYWEECNTCIHFDNRVASADFIRVRNNKYSRVQVFMHNNAPVEAEMDANIEGAEDEKKVAGD